jgi:hypothetical protein
MSRHVFPLAARYEILMNMNWVGDLGTKINDGASGCLDSASNCLDVEKIREHVFGPAYNGANGHGSSTNGSIDAARQWEYLLQVILQNMGFNPSLDASAVVPSGDSPANNPVGGASPDAQLYMDTAAIITSMAYAADIADTSKHASGTMQLGIAQQVASGSESPIANKVGIKALPTQTGYNNEVLGQLLNNTNVMSLLLQLHDAGCFQSQFGSSGTTVRVNTALEKDQAAGKNSFVLGIGDELRCPINLKVLNNNGNVDDVDVDAGLAFEIVLTFKQNVQVESTSQTDQGHNANNSSQDAPNQGFSPGTNTDGDDA